MSLPYGLVILVVGVDEPGHPTAMLASMVVERASEQGLASAVSTSAHEPRVALLRLALDGLGGGEVEHTDHLSKQALSGTIRVGPVFEPPLTGWDVDRRWGVDLVPVKKSQKKEDHRRPR